MSDHGHSLILPYLIKTTEEGFTFQCLGCWKVDCLTDIVKWIEMRMIKETDGIEIGGKERGRKEPM